MPSHIDYKSFELDQAAATGVARSSSRFGALAKSVPIVGGLAFAGYLIYSALPKPPGSLIKKDTEEFHTVQFPAPGLAVERAQLDVGRLVVPPPPV